MLFRSGCITVSLLFTHLVVRSGLHPDQFAGGGGSGFLRATFIVVHGGACRLPEFILYSTCHSPKRPMDTLARNSVPENGRDCDGVDDFDRAASLDESWEFWVDRNAVVIMSLTLDYHLRIVYTI